MKKHASTGDVRLSLIQKLTRIFNRPDQPKNNTVSRPGCDYSCQPLLNLLASLTRLEAEVHAVKEQVQRMQSILDAPKDGIENFTVEKMYVDKFELNVESIDVETVSGALNVGITHNSVVGMGQPGGMGAPGVGHRVKTGNLKKVINEHMSNGQQSAGAKARDRGEKKYTRNFYPNQERPKITVNKVG